MAGEPKGLPQLFWRSAIEAGTFAGATTEQIYNQIANALAAKGQDIVLPSVEQFNNLRHGAALRRNAALNVASSAPTEAIGAQHIGPVGEPGMSRATGNEAFQVRYSVITNQEGEAGLSWRTLTLSPEQLPETVGGLRNLAEAHAAGLLDTYEEEVIDVGSVQLLSL